MRIYISLEEQRQLERLSRAGGVKLRKREINLIVNPDSLPGQVEVEDPNFPEYLNFCISLLEEKE